MKGDGMIIHGDCDRKGEKSEGREERVNSEECMAPT